MTDIYVSLSYTQMCMHTYMHTHIHKSVYAQSKLHLVQRQFVALEPVVEARHNAAQTLPLTRLNDRVQCARVVCVCACVKEVA